MRPDAKLDGSKPISGGIPFCFPQFGPGEIQQHGFARNVDWAVVEQSETKVVKEANELFNRKIEYFHNFPNFAAIFWKKISNAFFWNCIRFSTNFIIF